MSKKKYEYLSDRYVPGIKHEHLIKAVKETVDPLYIPKTTKPALSRIGSSFMHRSDIMGFIDFKALPEDIRPSRPRHIFQFWTDEYLNGLADYLAGTGAERIIEVGAGDGELSLQLQDRGIDITPTDDFSWKIDRVTAVDDMDYKEAIEYFKPDYILASWMPYGSDWTAFFRQSPSVKEYCVIGEWGGCCGPSDTGEPEGWTVTEGYDFDEYNVCRTDYFWADDEGYFHKHSQTVTVRRN